MIRVQCSRIWLLLHNSRSSSVWVWTHNELLLGNFHWFWKLLDTCDSALSGMRWWSPWRVPLWSHCRVLGWQILIELWWWKTIIHILYFCVSSNSSFALIHFIWGLIWHLIVIWLFGCRWLHSECGFATDFRPPIRNLWTLKLVLFRRI